MWCCIRVALHHPASAIACGVAFVWHYITPPTQSHVVLHSCGITSPRLRSRMWCCIRVALHHPASAIACGVAFVWHYITPPPQLHPNIELLILLLYCKAYLSRSCGGKCSLIAGEHHGPRNVPFVQGFFVPSFLIL